MSHPCVTFYTLTCSLTYLSRNNLHSIQYCFIFTIVGNRNSCISIILDQFSRWWGVSADFMTFTQRHFTSLESSFFLQLPVSLHNLFELLTAYPAFGQRVILRESFLECNIVFGILEVVYWLPPNLQRFQAGWKTLEQFEKFRCK